MRGSSRALRALTAGALALAFTAISAPTASAATASCTYDAGTKTATVGYPANEGEDHVLGRSVAGAIQVDAVDCGAATVTNTDTIVVSNPAQGSQSLTIDETNGPFAPGATPEAKGISEIEINVTMGQGTDFVSIVGTPQADKITLSSATKTRLNGDSDADVTFGDTEFFSLYGQGGNDRLKVGLNTGGTYVYGGAGNDRITGGVEWEALYGDDGKDTIVAGDGADTLYGGTGNDSLTGGDGNDTIWPENGTDVASGGAGRDTIYFDPAADGPDTVSGGTGTDQVSYGTRTSGVSVSLDDVANDGAPGELDNIASDVENVDTGTGGDTLTGSGADNFLTGGGGADWIEGGGGDDVITDGGGNDFVFGGGGDDTLYAGQGDDVVSGEAGNDTIFADSVLDGSDTFDGGTGMDTVSYSSRSANLTLVISGTTNGETGENDSIGSNVENLYGGAGDDTITGSLADNQLVGGSGADTISAGAGKDSVYGGVGNDVLTGGDGADYVQGDSGNDTLHLTDGGADQAFCGDGTDDASDRDVVDTTLVACEVT